LLSVSNDLLELTGELEISQFGLIGWNAGAAYVLAINY
jgi:hypothetical protein